MQRKCHYIQNAYVFCILLLTMWDIVPANAVAQQNITINMAPIDGVMLTPANALNYQVHSSASEQVLIKGVIRYRNSGLRLSYSYNYNLKQGLNTPGEDIINPHWQFSSGALQELFLTHRILPSGTFEYCVTITPVKSTVEPGQNVFEECLYQRANEIFMINLVDPSDKAKIKEYNPLLAWVANYSIAGELTYRLRVAEMKQGQNAVNAVMRNQPVYDENGLIQNSIVYPVYAKALVANQPYAWTVDAYYKGILLGGAETWQFIIADTQAATVKGDRSYVDIKRESGLVSLTVVGALKLKYVLEDAQRDTLFLELLNHKSKKCFFSTSKLSAAYGDNRYLLDLAGDANLKHRGAYTLIIRTKTRKEYKLSFTYLNPDFQH